MYPPELWLSIAWQSKIGEPIEIFCGEYVGKRHIYDRIFLGVNI